MVSCTHLCWGWMGLGVWLPWRPMVAAAESVGCKRPGAFSVPLHDVSHFRPRGPNRGIGQIGGNTRKWRRSRWNRGESQQRKGSRHDVSRVTVRRLTLSATGAMFSVAFCQSGECICVQCDKNDGILAIKISRQAAFENYLVIITNHLLDRLH